MDNSKFGVKEIAALIIMFIIFLIAGRLEYKWQQEEIAADVVTIEEVRNY